jgi:DNA-binding CsgD family transcriptional regulator
MDDFTARERTALGLVFPLIVESVETHLAPPRGLALLTPAERGVVELLLRGLPDRTIAARLGVGYATVRTHIQHAFAKLRVSNRTELVHAIVTERPSSPVSS